MQAIQGSSSGLTADPGHILDTPASTVFDGDLGAEMAALAVENGEVERTTAHEERDAQEVAETQADAAQVSAMHDEASSMRAEGWFDAGVGIAGAGAKAYSPVLAAGVDATEKLGDGFFHAAQHADDADATAQKAAADQAQTAAKDDDQAANDAEARIGTVLDFDRNYSATEAQIQLAALHRA